MGWIREDDRRAYDDATLLQHHVGLRWVVFWGPASRRFWAFRRGASSALILSAPSPQSLFQQIRQADLSP